jgi:hypothetical protein
MSQGGPGGALFDTAVHRWPWAERASGGSWEVLVEVRGLAIRWDTMLGGISLNPVDLSGRGGTFSGNNRYSVVQYSWWNTNIARCFFFPSCLSFDPAYDIMVGAIWGSRRRISTNWCRHNVNRQPLPARA